MTVLTDWVATLTAQTYPTTELYIHTPNGFDPLGVLCEMFRTSTYSMLTGQGLSGRATIEGISVARMNLDTALQSAGGVPPSRQVPDPVAAALASTFWASDTATSATKLSIKQWRDGIDTERNAYEIAIISSPPSSGITSTHVAYTAALLLWTEWLTSLSGPGGWRDFLADWETQDWVLDSSQKFYSMDGIQYKLPESVQRWSDLLTADPVLTLMGTSTAGTDAKIPLNMVVDGLVQKVTGATHRPYTESEIIAFIAAYIA